MELRRWAGGRIMTSNIGKRRLLLHFRVTFFCCQVLKRDLPDTRQWSNLARRSFDYMLTLQNGVYRCLIITARGLYATPAGALYQIRRRYEYRRDGDCTWLRK